ncbi:hypothetical protein [Marinilabilia sp.]|uniref:hypothetical protein n=1 Tax=Marinilabilia sp. TaxID=2021252 RepID=UPI0025B8BF63|nr:hypothetical protein [Marinilabilia sp.]
MDKKNIILLFLFLCALSQLKAQNNVKYDTVYVARDTIVETVEVIRYEYVDVEPFELYVSNGVSYVETDIISESVDHVSGLFSVPLVLKLTKGNFFLQSGLEYRKVNFETSSLEDVAKEVERQITETVVVDTIFRYNDGDPKASVITKEVERTIFETEYNEELVVSYHDFSSFFVPLVAGYRFRFNKISADVGAGMGFNFFTSEARESLEKDFPDEDPVFFSYLINLSINYQLSSHFLLQGGISGAWDTNSSPLDFNQKQAGLKLLYKIF